MFGDSSPRTKQISTNAIFVIIAIVLILFSSIWTVVGMHRYDTLVLRSSTPLETKLKFTRSAADVVLSGIYTDAEKSALVRTTECTYRLNHLTVTKKQTSSLLKCQPTETCS